MSANRDRKVIDDTLAHELLMRDVLDAMENFAARFGFRPWPGQFEIIAVEQPGPDPTQMRVERKVAFLH